MIGIIPAAGKGLRFKELGQNYSKTILPYKEVPLLVHQVRFFKSLGISDIRIVVNHKRESIEQILKFFDITDVSLIFQEHQYGLSAAIFDALYTSFVDSKEDVLIVLGDIILKDPTSVKKYLKGAKTNILSAQQVQDYSRWCMVKESKNKLEFFDKPSAKPDTNLALSGMYYFKSADCLKESLREQIICDNSTRELELSEAISVYQKKANDYSVTDSFSLIQPAVLDFGTLDEYLTNRSVKSSREFNDIQDDDRFVIKSSKKNAEKIISEINWYRNLPDEIAISTPRILETNIFSENCSYKMEKIRNSSLRDIYLYLDNTEETWNNVFSCMFKTLDSMKEYGRENTFMDKVFQKTIARTKYIPFDIDEVLVNKFLENFKKNLNRREHKYSLMHGDFCFSNLLYDMDSRITMIDPRGDIFGEEYYDVAKIMHSVIYDYDFIDAELYVNNGEDIKIYTEGKDKLKVLFLNHLRSRYKTIEIIYIKYICASLFLSMIPLHSHNLQNQKLFYKTFEKITDELQIG